MTRKDYELIALALRESRRIESGSKTRDAGAAAQYLAACEQLAERLRGTNPRFDRERFLKACGVQS